MDRAGRVKLHPREKLRWQQRFTALVALVGLPVLLPVTGAVIAYQAWAVQLGWRTFEGGRRGSWWVRIWWWYGYHGLYQIDWAMKRRAA